MSGKSRFHSIYWRQFALTAGMVLLTLLLLGTSFFTLTYTYIMSEKKEELQEKAVMMAELSATYSRDYPLYSPIFGGENQGIRIIAQPPGKKLQNMMQLSGGEKALTAISLLFAIQNLKPSPFCLLDEIEAALDDSNVGRFAKYLHKLTKNTQFIVITHRRGTMEQVDRLYGITMQEKGVSTLVSVNLIDKELTA